MTKPRAYYNEIDEAAAHVLECLIKAGVIADGDVDRRSIRDVAPSDLASYTQCHFFAGGGIWSVAARLAGWPDDLPLWTGSCPCQPFSVAGKGAGASDPRHLWPDFFRLIRARRPAVVVGEQVAGAAGYGWFDGVSADLEGEGYASRAVDIPACAVDAPHIRQRLYWVAHSDVARAGAERQQRGGQFLRAGGDPVARDCDDMGHAESLGRRRRQDDEDERRRECAPADTGAGERPVEHADRSGRIEHRGAVAVRPELASAECAGGACEHAVGDAARIGWREGRAGDAVWQRDGSAAAGASFWSDSDLRLGADGKARRVKPGIRLLVDGLPGRVGLLRIGGNAIVPQVAAEVLAAFKETLDAGDVR